MKFIRRLKLRLSGNYRYRECVLGPKARDDIARTLDGDGFGSDSMNQYFREWLPYIDKMRKFSNRSRWVGKYLSYISLGANEDAVYRSFSGPQRFVDTFSVDNDHLSFNGVKMPIPNGYFDQRLFELLFLDIVVNYFFRKTNPSVCQFFGSQYYENDTVKLNNGDVVFDFGANSGFFSACASHSGCSVYSFEPTEYNRRYLNKTAELNPSIKVCPVALSDKNEKLDFYVIEGNTGATREVKSLATMKDSQPKGFNESVQAVAIDDYIGELGIDGVNFIKADIEGAERHMLAGAKKVLKEHAPKLALCTYHLPDDPKVMWEIILEANPNYKIHQGSSIMYAHV